MRGHAKVLVAVLVLVVVSLGSVQAIADTTPSVTMDEPTALTQTTVHVSGTVNPNGGPSEAGWHFEYSTDNATWQEGGEGGNAGAGNSPVPVAADITGLTPGTFYYVRLVAGNEGGTVTSATRFFSTEPAPAPEATLDPVVGPNGLSAHFSGTVDPNGFKTNYRFELAIDNGDPQWQPFGAGSSESNAPVAIEADRDDLVAQTKYLVRIVATSPGGTATTGATAFATGALAPNVRVLPGSGRTTSEVRLNATINANGLPTTYRFEYGPTATYGSSIPASGPGAYGGQGTEMVRYSKPVLGLAPNSTIHYRVVAENAAGVSTSPDQTVTTLSQEVRYEMVSPPDKANGNLFFRSYAHLAPSGDAAQFLSAASFAGSPASVQVNPYRAVRGSDNWSTQSMILPQSSFNGGFSNGATQGFSPDLSRVISFSRQVLAPGAVAGNSNMYLRNADTGSVVFLGTSTNTELGMGIGGTGIFLGSSIDGTHMIFRFPDALTPNAIPGQDNLYDYSDGHIELVSLAPDGSAMSGTRTIGTGEGKEYLARNGVSRDGKTIFFSREDGSLYVHRGGETVLVSRSHRSGDDPTAPVGVWDVWASEDGSAVYFLSRQPLTDDAPMAPEFTGVFRYDVASDQLTYVPMDVGPPGTNFAKKIFGVSADGSTVFFGGGENLEPCCLSNNSYPMDRIFRNHDGVTEFVAKTSAALEGVFDFGAVSSPNGRYLAINAKTPTLTSPPSNPCTGCTEIYIYDAVTDDIECASCNPDGSVTDETALPREAAENIGGYVNNALLDDGSVFFQSRQRLLPEDTNDKLDIYRWRAGQLDLISPGKGTSDSFYGDATPDGSSVAFYTGEQLVGQDVDHTQDLYVARVGGGLSAQNPPAPPAPCFGEGCLNRSPDPPPDVTPGSNGFAGPANPKAANARKSRCAKGRKARKSHGKTKCVKAKKAKKQRQRGHK